MVSLLAASAFAVAFPGGNISDLAKSIAENTKQNVVILAGAAETAKPFTYDPENLNEMSRAIFTATGLRQAPGTDHAYHRGRLGSWLFQLNAVKLLQEEDEAWRPGSAPLANKAEQAGLVTVRHEPGQSSQVDVITGLLGEKDIRIHWSLQGVVFKAWTTNQPAKDFVQLVAKATGTRLVSDKDGFLLDLDLNELSRRAQKTLDATAKHKKFKDLDETDQQQVHLTKAVLAAASQTQLKEAFSTPQGTAKVEIGFSLRPAVQRYLETWMKQSTEVGPEQSGMRQVDAARAQEGIKRVDRRLIGHAQLNGTFQAKLFLQTVDAQGRPGPVFQVP